MNTKLTLILLVLLASFSSSSCSSEGKSDSEWLYGEWHHTYDPDGDPDDMLNFFRNGKFMTTEISSGKIYNGTYILKSDTIIVKLLNNGHVFMSFNLTYNENHDTLYFKSDKTGNTSHYTKNK